MASGRITSAFVQSKPGVGTHLLGKDADLTRAGSAAPAHGGLKQDSPLDASEMESDERTLRQFDLDTKYGPVSGISRLQRWDRAVALGLNPSPQIRNLIVKYGEDSDMNKHLFAEGKV